MQVPIIILEKNLKCDMTFLKFIKYNYQYKLLSKYSDARWRWERYCTKILRMTFLKPVAAVTL